MATQSKAMKTSADADSLLSLNKRIIAKMTQKVLFGATAAADVEMAAGYPVAYNKSTGKFAPWMAPDPTKIVVTLTGSSGGTWGLTINGVVLANTTFAYNVTAALVQETLRSYGYEATVVKAAAIYTITFNAQREIETLPVVTGDVTQITGGSGHTATADAGTATNGTNLIHGFVYPETVTTDQTDDVHGVVMTEGEITVDEVTDLVASGDVTACELALKDGLIAKGLIVQGLVGVH